MSKAFPKDFSFFYIATLIILFSNCSSRKNDHPLFEVLDNTKTGLDFTNKLTPTQDFNVFDYMYFYNGAGVGAGDFNNDGKIDLFFAANQGDDKIYLNEGNLKFKDVTKEAQIPQDGGWSTGISVIDINNDGFLDIYICRVSNIGPLRSKNQLLICQGIDKNGVPYYKDEAHEYGLDFSGFSTQAVFFDYDGDGDLDMFLLNHSVHQNGTFGARDAMSKIVNPSSGDRIFRNDGNNHFTDVTAQTGIHSSVLGYGLGVCVSDINLDGYPDMYVCNDFHENDYLYINQKNGTFKDESTNQMMHTSEYSMGVDVADINNDAYPEIITMDMQPSDPYILKRSLGEDQYDLFYEKIKYGYGYQYTRNDLQLNRRNGMFSEVGLYAGVYATDWSWSPLWIDFDNDGLKDLFISNGIPKRLNDIDYVNYVSNDEVQNKMHTNTLDKKDMALIDKFPQIKIPNKFFRNDGSLLFSDEEKNIDNEKSTYSNGAVAADFDNDGDLDVVVNNIDEPALLYENKTRDDKSRHFIELKLKGSDKNINAIGAKIILYANDSIRTYEKFPVRGFMSSAEAPIHIGLYKTKIDSLLLVWPDNTYQYIKTSKIDTALFIKYKTGLPKFNYTTLTSHWKNKTKPMEDITRQTNLNYLHTEDEFQEFDREPLIPHMLSTEGPGLAVEDINHDGLQDVFIGSSKWEKSAVFIQTSAGTFKKINEPALDKDSTYEDVDACWADVNNDGNPDLIVASGGNEFYGQDINLSPRVYLNDGKGNLTKSADAFDNLFVNASCVAPYDFNSDGHVDLFIGGRDVPWNYGQVPQSYLLENNGEGKFIDVTDKVAKDLSHLGFITNAIWCDLNNDGKKDLIVTLEWGGIIAFINHNGNFEKKVLCDKKGWWNFVLPVDLNNDGKIDLIAGNLGLNHRLKASEKEPVRLYYNDFDDNGKKEQLLTYYLGGKEIPFATKDELQKQMPVMKKKFLYAEDFAKATLQDLFTKEKLNSSEILTANYFANAILINKGNLNFDVQPMPWLAQLSPYRDAVVVDANGDNLPDVLLVGNYYENNIEMGRNDADFGTILLNKGNNKFSAESINGLEIKDQSRHIRPININKSPAFIVAKNNDSAMVIRFRK